MVVAFERADGSISRAQTIVFPSEHVLFGAGVRHAERLVKSLLWMWGGHKIYYDIGYVPMLGRVTSGEAGPIILEKARQVLKAEFPDLAGRLSLRLPDGTSRRVGQAVAAASLPVLERT